MEALMIDRIRSSLHLFMHHNAIFLCERLCAEFPSEVNLQLLATCYLQNNQAYCVYHLLKGAKLPQSRYLFAISCFQLNLLREAEVALSSANDPNLEVPNGAAGHYLLGLIYRYTGRRTCAINHLMQALAIDPLLWSAYEELCKLGAAEDASQCFSNSVAVKIKHHYLSESISDNSSIASEDQNLPSTFEISSGDLSPRQHKLLHPTNSREIPIQPHGIVTAVPAINSGPTNMSQYNTPSPTAQKRKSSEKTENLCQSDNEEQEAIQNKRLCGLVEQCLGDAVAQPSGVAPPPLCRNAQLYINTLVGDASTRSNGNLPMQAPRRKFVDEGKLRKVSGRLFSDSALRRNSRLSGEATGSSNSNVLQVGGNGSNHSSAKVVGGFSPSSKTNLATSRSTSGRKGVIWSTESLDEGRRTDTFDDLRMDNFATVFSSVSSSADARYLGQGNATERIASDPKSMRGKLELLGLLRILGEGYRLSCLYRCHEALEAYFKLSQNQFNTGWVLSQVGRAHFELIDYVEADRLFDLARRVSPHTLEGMDIYSTVLYHLKEEKKLSYLALELISVDRLSSQAWCALGNCYSLQKDHETALKSFQRALHLDSRFAYAHTLCGHEYVALEDFDNGIKCYQSALQIDERHYNAWYGLGVVYLRQERLEFAEHHFRRAYHINPRCSIIRCYLGMSLHALKRNEEALDMMEHAISADTKNPLPVYQKANILVSLERFDEALKELEQLKDSEPRETSIYALMGKIYKRLDLHEKAMFYFGLALDLKPPAADVAVIKAAVEKLYLPDDLEDAI